MPIITFATSKGGAGKTTSAIILATTLARSKKVAVLDADPAKRLHSWAKKAPLPDRLKVFVTLGEKHIQDEIEELSEKFDYVILDLEGAATRLNAYAMAESDLVIIPMGDEQQDAEAAIETVAYLGQEARTLRRTIPMRILFARTKPAVKSRLQRSLNAQIRDKIGSFTTELHERTAFSSLHNLGGTLYGMDPNDVSGVAKAIGNAELFVEELLETLTWINDAKRFDRNDRALNREMMRTAIEKE